MVRFWAKVNRDGPVLVEELGPCWIWAGWRQLGPDGSRRYGLVRRADQSAHAVYAHRVSYEIEYGPVPPGFDVCHRCDNPPCVRPTHFFLGTHLENIADMVAKGRHTIGARHPQAKVTPAQVTAIREHYAAGGVLQRELGAEFGLSQSQVSAIVRGDHWQSPEAIPAYVEMLRAGAAQLPGFDG